MQSPSLNASSPSTAVSSEYSALTICGPLSLVPLGC